MEEMKYTCATCGAKAHNLKLITDSWMLIDGEHYCCTCGLDKLNENKKKDGEAGVHKGRKGKGK